MEQQFETQIFNIKGQWTKGNSEDYNDYDMFEGQFLLYTDGWFEGVVKEPESENYVGYRMIYGVYSEKKIILYEESPIEKRTLIRFEVDKDSEEERYDGKYWCMPSNLPESYIGNSCIETEDIIKENGIVDSSKKNVERRKRVLKEVINQLKGSDGFLRRYQQILSQRETLCQTINNKTK